MYVYKKRNLDIKIYKFIQKQSFIFLQNKRSKKKYHETEYKIISFNKNSVFFFFLIASIISQNKKTSLFIFYIFTFGIFVIKCNLSEIIKIGINIQSMLFIHFLKKYSLSTVKSHFSIKMRAREREIRVIVNGKEQRPCDAISLLGHISILRVGERKIRLSEIEEMAR